MHHDFEMLPEEFAARCVVTAPRIPDWRGEYASRPLRGMEKRNVGGARSTAGYVALVAQQTEDQFYIEATPYWQRPHRTLDLRDTSTSLHLKAITPIKTNHGYRPYLFIAHYDEPSDTFCGWYYRQELIAGEEWTLNELELRNDENLWTRYTTDLRYTQPRRLDVVLGNVGFIGVMYLRDTDFTGVGATGILGLDEFRYGFSLEKER